MLAHFEVKELGRLRIVKLTGAGALNRVAKTLAQLLLIDRFA